MTHSARWMLVAALAAGLAFAGYRTFDRGARTLPESAWFVTLQGEQLTAEALRGKVVLVNFWTTSCTICVEEMPRLVATYRKYHASGLETIAVAMSYDPPNHVIQYAETTRLPFKVALDPMGALAGGFGDVRLTPTTFLIDREGRVVKRYVGAPDFAELERLVEATLAAPA